MRLLLVIAAGLAVGGCSSSARFTSSPYTPGAGGTSGPVEEGIASYYADEFNGRLTANGEIFDMNQLTAAHRSYPFNTKVRVINKSNGKSIIVRINDRGPFKNDRIIDLSRAAATEIDMISSGTAPVRLEVISVGTPVP
jgi:rare lipoprotein A